MAIAGFDEFGEITFSNPATHRITGLTPLDMQGTDIHTVLHEVTGDGAPVPPAQCRL